MLKEKFQRILLESSKEYINLEKQIQDDKAMHKAWKKGSIKFLDAVYSKYSKDIDKILKKDKMDFDEFATILLKIKKMGT